MKTKTAPVPHYTLCGEKGREPRWIKIRHEGGEDMNLKELNLYAAAPELLEAIYAIQQGFDDGSIKWAKPRQADTDPYHQANVKMCAAIAKAEGR